MFLLKYIAPAAVLAMLASGTCPASAAAPGEVRWHNEGSDTIVIQELLNRAAAIESPTAQGRIGAIAREFIGKPYVAATLEGSEEMVTVNMDEFDCTTFMETVAALAKTAGERRRSWHDFVHNLEELRYRRGKAEGYASRLHYISDWAIDNSQRGNIAEVTGDLPGASWQIKTLDFMTSHRDSYPALADEDEFQRLKSIEIGYRSHRFPMVKSTRITKATLAALRDGDIVALTAKAEGLDVTHVGLIAIVDGVPHLLHASSAEGKVVIDSKPLTEYLRRSKSATGIRVFRLKD